MISWLVAFVLLIAIWRNEYKNPMSLRFGRVGRSVSATLVVLAILAMVVTIEYGTSIYATLNP